MISSLSNEAIETIDKQRQDRERQFGRTIAIHAPARKGKTLTMIMLIMYYIDRLSYIKGIISNLNLTLPPPYDKLCVPLGNLKKISDYRSYILAIDEFRTMVDSRMSGSFRNIFISNILKDTGKLRQIFLYTDQESGSIDKRIRINVDAVLKPDINFDTGIMTVKVVKNYNMFWTIDAYSKWGEWTDEFYFPFREYYDYYDTEQKIEEYMLGFTPEEHYEIFMGWFEERGYTDEIQVTMSTLKLFKSMKPELYLTNEQLSGLMEYMRRETELNIRGKKKSKE